MVVSCVLRLLFRRPKKPRIPSSRPLKQKQAQRRRRKNIARSTPMTIPAIAPPLRPLLLTAGAAAVLVAAAFVGVPKGTVVVSDPVVVTVVAALLVGRKYGVLVAVVVTG